MTLLSSTGEKSGSMRTLSVLRIFRLLRIVKIFRVLNMVRELRLLVGGLAAGVKALTWAVILLGIFLYVSAIFACTMVGTNLDADDPTLDMRMSPLDWDDPREQMRTYFG